MKTFIWIVALLSTAMVVNVDAHKTTTPPPYCKQLNATFNDAILLNQLAANINVTIQSAISAIQAAQQALNATSRNLTSLFNTSLPQVPPYSCFTNLDDTIYSGIRCVVCKCALNVTTLFNLISTNPYNIPGSKSCPSVQTKDFLEKCENKKDKKH